MDTNIFMRTQRLTRELFTQLNATPLSLYAFMAVLAVNYFNASGISLPEERRGNIISISRESLGEYDFFFEWLKGPSFEQLYKLIEKIDEDLSQLGCYYTITTKK
jgi:prephenate dehydratase